GSLDSGTIYTIGKDGSGFSIIYHFSYKATDGFNPNAELIRASDGALYGTTFFGGEFDNGTIFRIMPVGLTAHPSTNRISVTLTGFIGQRYAIESAASLSLPWNQVATVTNVNASVEFLDPANSRRFYRGRLVEP